MSLVYLEQVRENAIKPSKGSTHAACFDLFACIDVNSRLTGFNKFNQACTWHPLDDADSNAIDNSVHLDPGDRLLIPTGWKMRPKGSNKCIHVYGRSGKGLKMGLGLPHSVGIIDFDYSEEVFVPLVNTSNEVVIIKNGDGVGQMRLVDVHDTELKEVPTLPGVSSSREGGFGSTGN